MSTAGRPDVAPLVGLTVRLAKDARDHAERLSSFLEGSSIRHVRLEIEPGELAEPGGEAWTRWLLGRLSEKAEVMPSFAALRQAGSVDTTPLAGAIEIALAWPDLRFEHVELALTPDRPGSTEAEDRLLGELAGRLVNAGKKPVLAVGSGQCRRLEVLAGSGGLAGFAAVALRGDVHRGLAPPGELSPVLPAFQEVLAGLGEPVELWVGETGSPTSPAATGRQLAAFAQALALPVARVYWHGFGDPKCPTTGDNGAPAASFGLLDADGHPDLLARLLQMGGPAAALENAQRTRARAHGGQVRPMVVTGGAGFIGSGIADRLAGDGQTVLLLDNLEGRGAARNVEWLKERHGKKIVLVAGDVRDRELVRETISHAGAVLHLAGQVAVTRSLKDPQSDFETNAQGTLNVLEALRALHSPPSLLFASSAKVYGQLVTSQQLRRRQDRYVPEPERLAGGCDETTPLDLRSPYGCSKGTADQYVLDYARTFELRAAVLRMGSVYGPRQHGDEDHGWVTHLLRSGLAGRQITIYGDGCQVRDLLFIDDCVEAWLRALAKVGKLSGRAFNLGGGPCRAVSLLDVLMMMGRVAGVHPKVRHAPWRTGDQLWYVSCTRAFEQATGWQATVEVEAGLRRLLAWLQGAAAPASVPQRSLALA